jgi:hypothetical protein
MKNRYRIVTDKYLGYEVQVKKWYWPFWVQCNLVNTHNTLERAKEYLKIQRDDYVVVYEE